MSDETKLTLSADELAVAQDLDFILTKSRVLEKAAALFNSLLPCLNDTFRSVLHQNDITGNSVPKISKGENYNGFPYLILDHPAVFGKKDVFALRTMFWWGNFFSIALHISGKFKTVFEERIIEKVLQEDLFISTGDEEWQHHFGPDNFMPFGEVTQQQLTEIMSKNFMKVALKFDLNNWNNMPQLLPGGYKKIALLLQTSE